MQFYGYHGVHKFEKEKGGPFEVDVEIKTNLASACKTDDVNQTIDYEAVYNQVKQCVTENKFNLIEALAELIGEEIISNFKVDELTIRVRKPEAIIKGKLDTVEVEISRKREDYA